MKRTLKKHWSKNAPTIRNTNITPRISASGPRPIRNKIAYAAALEILG